MKTECGDFFYIALDSDGARMLREHLNSQRKPEVKLLDPPPSVRIEEEDDYDITALKVGLFEVG